MSQRRRVPADVYDEAYLLSASVEGFDEFQRGGLSRVKEAQLDLLDLRPGLQLLEVGIGRGEFLAHCAHRGARVTGLDYSAASLKIARETMAPVEGAKLLLADCKGLPFVDASFDRVYSGDVLEHQDIEDGATMLREMHRVLRPGGFLLVHTSPNTIFTRLTYPVTRPLLRLLDPASIKVFEQHLEVGQLVHVQEYNVFSLRKVARLAGLHEANVWIGADVLRSGQDRHTQRLSQNPIVKLGATLARFKPIRLLLGNDLFVKAAKRQP